MRIPLANLLARNPLPKVGDLMTEVVRTSERVQDLIELLAKGDQAGVERVAKEISVMEGKADDAKNVARSKMPVRLLMPVDRRDVLKLISEIDAIADCAEDVGVLLTIRPLSVSDGTRSCRATVASWTRVATTSRSSGSCSGAVSTSRTAASITASSK